MYDRLIELERIAAESEERAEHAEWVAAQMRQVSTAARAAIAVERSHRRRRFRALGLIPAAATGLAELIRQNRRSIAASAVGTVATGAAVLAVTQTPGHHHDDGNGPRIVQPAPSSPTLPRPTRTTRSPAQPPAAGQPPRTEPAPDDILTSPLLPPVHATPDLPRLRVPVIVRPTPQIAPGCAVDVRHLVHVRVCPRGR